MLKLINETRLTIRILYIAQLVKRPSNSNTESSEGESFCSRSFLGKSIRGKGRRPDTLCDIYDSIPRMILLRKREKVKLSGRETDRDGPRIIYVLTFCAKSVQLYIYSLQRNDAETLNEDERRKNIF